MIEEFGLIFEAHGIPRMAGRILGRLLMCHPPHQSLAQLGRDLQASKGSVSTMTRLLIDRRMAERVTFPGDRLDFIRVRSGSAGELFRDVAQHSALQTRLLERALEVVDDASPEGTARIREAHDFFSFMRDEVPTLLARWEARRAAAALSPDPAPSGATPPAHPPPDRPPDKEHTPLRPVEAKEDR